ncbi:hypothetical protein [Alcaligenes faecalis]|uniref:hypothetical protein n=1 Tax=Alcaligenes faecalis TaxID=511 RepID=UPI001EEF8602|nr:hypothetical protein [Alcaligenes faecalis]ULH08204.1 hypothetical protein MF263_07065 [Alcaligenes faecalis]
MALNSTQANILAKELFLEVSSNVFFKEPKDLSGEICVANQAVMNHRETYFATVFQEIVAVLQG